jgi:hypothetical protein
LAAGMLFSRLFTTLCPAFTFSTRQVRRGRTVCNPRPAIINLMSYKPKEGKRIAKRIAIAAFIEEKHEHEWQIDVIHPNEIPKIASFCGWMRNEREEKEYEYELRQKGTR